MHERAGKTHGSVVHAGTSVKVVSPTYTPTHTQRWLHIDIIDHADVVPADIGVLI
jgi:hypothetical protein